MIFDALSIYTQFVFFSGNAAVQTRVYCPYYTISSTPPRITHRALPTVDETVDCLPGFFVFVFVPNRGAVKLFNLSGSSFLILKTRDWT